jgi:hypothetical protein
MAVVTSYELEAESAADQQTVYVSAQDSVSAEEKLKFGKADWVLAGLGGLLATSVSVIGLMSSYKALERKAALPAAQGGWAWSEPWMLPIGLDLSILAFSIVNLILIRVDRPARWVRWVPRLGAAGTIYLNWVSAGSLASQIGHAVLAALWVVFSEIAAHVYAAQIDAIHHRPRMEGIRFSRWFLDPWSTAVISRQMQLWEITRYVEALGRHRALKVYEQGLRHRYGVWWRFKAPTEELLPVRLARYGYTVAEALDIPANEANAAALRAHEAGVGTRALALRLREEEATAALAEVQRQAAIDAANARAEAERLSAEAELIRAREAARTAADAVVRDAELAQQIKEAEAVAEAERLRTEAAAKAAQASAEAEAEVARIRREQEKAQLSWQAEQQRLRLEQQQAELAARLEAERLERELRDAAALAEAESARLLAEKEKAAAAAAAAAADARRRAAEDARIASVAEAEASVARAEKERREAEEEAARIAAEAQAASLAREMAVALEEASVAHASARRTPAEREAYMVADMIERFGPEKVTLRFISEALGLPHSTAQDRRDRARQILAERPAGTTDGQDATSAA